MVAQCVQQADGHVEPVHTCPGDHTALTLLVTILGGLHGVAVHVTLWNVP